MSLFSSALLLLATLVAHAADAPKYIILTYGTAYTLSPAQADLDGVPQAMETRIPITYGASQTKDSLDLQVADVASQTTAHPPELQACFQTLPLSETAFTLTAKLDPQCSGSLRPATYLVTLTAKPRKGAKPAQTIPLQITMPAAELKALTSQSIDRVAWIGFGEPTLVDDSLTLYETGKKAPVTNLTIEQTEHAKVDTNEVGGKVHFTPAAIPPGKWKSITIHTTGDFPPGTAKTVVTLDSPQLAAPMTIAYEIRTRYRAAYVPFFIVIGLIVGFLMRVTLASIIAGNTDKLAALELEKEMRGELARRSDRDFKTQVEKQLDDLRKAIKQKKDLATKTKELEAALSKAISDLQDRINAVINDIETTAARAQNASRYPQPIAALLTDSSTSLDKARTLAHTGDAASARDELRAFETDQAARLETAANAWAEKVGASLIDLGNLPPLPAAASMTSPIAAVQAGLDSIRKATDVDSRLNAIATAASAIRHQIENTNLKWLAKYAENIAGKYDQQGKDTKTIRPAANALRNAIAADTSLTMEGPIAATRDLLAALTAAIGSAADAGKQAKVQELLGGGSYFEAALETLGAGGGPMGEGGATPPSLLTDLFRTIPQTVRAVSAIILSRPDPIVWAEAQSWLTLAAARLLQFVFVAIGVTLIGTLALGPTFDGTCHGLTLAFFWGYVSDLTAEGLISSAGKLR